jgi:two-component system NtrC family response regulator
MKPKLLIVDDDEEILTQMKWALAMDYEILPAGDRAGAMASFASQHPEVVMLDLGLPPHPNSPEEGLATLTELLSQDPLAKIVIITGQGEKENALRAIGAGAYDFLCKPVEMDPLRLVLKRGFYLAGLEREYRELQRSARPDGFENILGNSLAMRKVFDTIRKVATTDAPVLILGESGTGKEMVARAVHQRSARKDGPFVAINCGAIPENLLESELFGHEKGAFTGAHVQREGRIENARGGTLFLDEVGEMPPSLQVKLLRFLQEQRIVRVGGREEIEVEARVIAATNSDVQKNMAEGAFREDLFYRLAVVQIKLPPLRDREDDVCLLAQSFLLRAAAQVGKNGLTFGEQAIRAMKKHPWPGNVRELENRVKRAVIMAEEKRLTAQNLELSEPSGGLSRTLKEARAALEKEMVQRALRKYDGNITLAAEELGVSRPTLYELIEKLGIVQE